MNTGNIHDSHNIGFQYTYQIYLCCSVGLKLIKNQGPLSVGKTL